MEKNNFITLVFGVIGGLLLLFLIPMCFGLKDSKKEEVIEENQFDSNEIYYKMTTWHSMETMMPSILGCAKRCGVTTHAWSPVSSAKDFRKETAAMLRRVSFEGNTYETAGWIERDTADLVVKT